MTTLVTGLVEPVDISVDKRQGNLYYSTGCASTDYSTGCHNIYMSNVDGGDLSTFLEASATDYQPNGISVDTMNGYIYFAGINAIYKCPTNDASDITAVYSGLYKPYGVSVDWEQNLLFDGGRHRSVQIWAFPRRALPQQPPPPPPPQQQQQ